MSEQPESPRSGPADVPDSRNSSDIEQSLRDELQAVERRAAFLSEASSVLAASSLNVEATIHALSRLATSRLADWCMVYTTDRMGRVRHAAVAHRDPRREPLLRSPVRAPRRMCSSRSSRAERCALSTHSRRS